MLLDKFNTFLDNAALPTSGTGVINAGDVIDLVSGNALNDAHDLYLVIIVRTAVTSAGAATVQFLLVSDAQNPIATDGSATQHWASAAIGKATLVGGYRVAIVPLPKGSPAYERYLGLQVNVGTAALTAGAVTAGLTATPSTWLAIADGVN